MSKKNCVLLLVVVLFSSTLLYAQTESVAAIFDLYFEGADIGDATLEIIDLGNEGIRINSNSSFEMNERSVRYVSSLFLGTRYKVEEYRVDLTQDGYKQQLRFTIANGSVRISYSTANRQNQNWSVDAPGEDWIFFDSNSMIGFYLFSLQVSPGMEATRGNLFIAPTRQFGTYEIQSNGPAVTVINGNPTQCDLYTLIVNSTVRYQMYISGTKLLSVKQEGNELSIRSRQ